MFGDFDKQVDPTFSLFSQILENHDPEPVQKERFQQKKVSNRGRPKGQKNVCKKKQTEKIQGSVKESRKTGHWSYEQNKKYHWFLEIYNQHFFQKHLRRTDKIFKVMESFIGTRQAQQCRSHHQKMQKKYKTFEQILLHLRILHYRTQDHTIITEQLYNNNIELSDKLITSQQLHKQIMQPKKQNNVQQQMEIAIQFGQENKAIQNIFSDKYENNMDLHSFLS